MCRMCWRFVPHVLVYWCEWFNSLWGALGCHGALTSWGSKPQTRHQDTALMRTAYFWKSTPSAKSKNVLNTVHEGLSCLASFAKSGGFLLVWSFLTTSAARFLVSALRHQDNGRFPSTVTSLFSAAGGMQPCNVDTLNPSLVACCSIRGKNAALSFFQIWECFRCPYVPVFPCLERVWFDQLAAAIGCLPGVMIMPLRWWNPSQIGFWPLTPNATWRSVVRRPKKRLVQSTN